MIRLVALLLLVLFVGALAVPALRESLAWVLAFLSLLMLGDLARSSFTKARRDGSASSSRRA